MQPAAVSSPAGVAAAGGRGARAHAPNPPPLQVRSPSRGVHCQARLSAAWSYVAGCRDSPRLAAAGRRAARRAAVSAGVCGL